MTSTAGQPEAGQVHDDDVVPRRVQQGGQPPPGLAPVTDAVDEDDGLTVAAQPGVLDGGHAREVTDR